MIISKLKNLLQYFFFFIALIFSSCEKIVGITTENCSSIERFWVRSTPESTTYWDFNNNQHGGVIKGEYKNGDCNITDGFLLIRNLADTLILSKDNKLDTFRLNLTCKSMTLRKVENKKSSNDTLVYLRAEGNPCDFAETDYFCPPTPKAETLSEFYTYLRIIRIKYWGTLLALDVIQKTHNFKSKNGMLVNGSLTLYVVSYKSSTS